MRKYFPFILILFVFIITETRAANLPEFFGCYFKCNDESFIEIPPNKSLGSTGWFVKQKRPVSNDLNSIQKQFASGGDLGAALNAQSNKKIFLYRLSNMRIENSRFKGFIVYGEHDADDIKIVRLTNDKIPENATLVSYSGPNPADRRNMWFLEITYSIQIKPLANNMYYLKTKEPIIFGQYALVVGREIFDFEVLNDVSQSAIERYSHLFSGTWGGDYICSQGATGLTMEISTNSSNLAAIFNFYPLAQNPKIKSGSFKLTGQFSENGSFVLQPKSWISQPKGYRMVGMAGEINTTELSGSILSQSCSSFQLHKQ